MESSATAVPMHQPVPRREPERGARRLRADLDRPFRSLRHLVLGIKPHEVRFDRRGFRWTDIRTRQHLEHVGQAFLEGYHAALDDDRLAVLEWRLTTIDLQWRGFGFEGAAMALVLRDRLAPWRTSRYTAFLAGPGASHGYMVLVGAGWALARLKQSPLLTPIGADPLLRWLVVDGFGFHEAYFDWAAAITRQQVPARLHSYARRAFDQGMGRALWFVNGADPALIAEALARFPEPRRADLWSGIGLACAYAGGVGHPEVVAIKRAAGPWLPDLAQGIAFAAETRARAGNMAPHTELACRLVGDLSAMQAATLVNRARLDLPPDGAEPAYEVWRRRIRAQFKKEVASA